MSGLVARSREMVVTSMWLTTDCVEKVDRRVGPAIETASMPVRENTQGTAGLRSAHPVSRLQPWIERRESAGLFERSPGVHWRNGLAAGGKRMRTGGPTVGGKNRNSLLAGKIQGISSILASDI